MREVERVAPPGGARFPSVSWEQPAWSALVPRRTDEQLQEEWRAIINRYRSQSFPRIRDPAGTCGDKLKLLLWARGDDRFRQMLRWLVGWLLCTAGHNLPKPDVLVSASASLPRARASEASADPHLCKPSTSTDLEKLWSISADTHERDGRDRKLHFSLFLEARADGTLIRSCTRFRCLQQTSTGSDPPRRSLSLVMHLRLPDFCSFLRISPLSTVDQAFSICLDPVQLFLDVSVSARSTYEFFPSHAAFRVRNPCSLLRSYFGRRFRLTAISTSVETHVDGRDPLHRRACKGKTRASHVNI